MSLFLDAFWRAVAYCIHPRVIALSFLPLLVMVALSLGLGWLYWDAAVAAVSAWLESSAWIATIAGWLQTVGWVAGAKPLLAPLIVVVAVTPLIVLGSLLVVALLMSPALVSLVAQRRFPQLERRRGGSFLLAVLWSLGSTLLALVAPVSYTHLTLPTNREV